MLLERSVPWSTGTLSAQELMSIFYEVLKENEALVQAALSDIIAYRERVRAGAPTSLHARADSRHFLEQHKCCF